MASKKKEKTYELNINGAIIPYTLVKSSRRSISIQIGTGGKMTVRCPLFCGKWMVDNFLNEKNFILKGIDLGHVEKYILTIYKS